MFLLAFFPPYMANIRLNTLISMHKLEKNSAEKDLYDHVTVFLKLLFRETHKNTQLAFTDGENKINKHSVMNIKYAEHTHALIYNRRIEVAHTIKEKVK